MENLLKISGLSTNRHLGSKLLENISWNETVDRLHILDSSDGENQLLGGPKI